MLKQYIMLKQINSFLLFDCGTSNNISCFLVWNIILMYFMIFDIQIGHIISKYIMIHYIIIFNNICWLWISFYLINIIWNSRFKWSLDMIFLAFPVSLQPNFQKKRSSTILGHRFHLGNRTTAGTRWTRTVNLKMGRDVIEGHNKLYVPEKKNNTSRLINTTWWFWNMLKENSFF